MFSNIRARTLPSTSLLVLLGIALCVRLTLVAYALLHFGPRWFFSRGTEMGFLADSLLHGHGLSSPFGLPTGPTAIVAPGYPLLVSSIFFVFGSYTFASALCLMLLHAACNTATVWLIYRLSRQIAAEPAALVVSLFWACSLPLIWMPTIFWETSLSTLFVIGMVSAMLSLRPQAKVTFWAVCGCVCGLAGLLNPALLPSLSSIALWTLFTKASAPTRWRGLTAFLLGAGLVFAPWPMRNAREFHTLVLTRTTVGLELWMGNHPGATGFLEPSLFPTYNKAEMADYLERGEVGYTTHKGQLARAYIEAHPVTFVVVSCRRFARFWTGNGTRPASALFSLHGTITFALGFCGLVLLWRAGKREVCLLLAIPLLIFPLPYYLTHAEFRYRLVLDPLLTVLSAATVDLLLQRRHLRISSEPKS